MNPSLIRLPAITLAGYVCHTTTRLGESFFIIPQFWQEYMREGKMDRLLGESFAQSRIQYGVCFPEDPVTGNFDYLIGVPAAEGTTIPKPYEVRELPAASYAVFSSTPAAEKDFSAAVYNTWAHIFGTWLPSSNMKIDGKGLQFELYDERACRETAKVCDIYIPVIPKSAPALQSSPNTAAVKV
jgi:AraC family transcriptional regulator